MLPILISPSRSTQTPFRQAAAPRFVLIDASRRPSAVRYCPVFKKISAVISSVDRRDDFRSRAAKFVTLLFMLWTPFVMFVQFHNYAFLTPEILLCLTGLALMAATFTLLMVFGGVTVEILVTMILMIIFLDMQTDWSGWSQIFFISSLLGIFILLLGRNTFYLLSVIFLATLLTTVLLPNGNKTATASSTVRDTPPNTAAMANSRRTCAASPTRQANALSSLLE